MTNVSNIACNMQNNSVTLPAVGQMRSIADWTLEKVGKPLERSQVANLYILNLTDHYSLDILRISLWETISDEKPKQCSS